MEAINRSTGDTAAAAAAALISAERQAPSMHGHLVKSPDSDEDDVILLGRSHTQADSLKLFLYHLEKTSI